MAKSVHVRFGGKRGKRFALRVSDDLMVVRTHGQGSVRDGDVAAKTHVALDPFESVFRIPEAGVEVLRCRAPRAVRSVRDRARVTVGAEESVRFAGRGLATPAGRPVLYTENLFVQFGPAVSAAAIRRIWKEHGLAVKRELPYAVGAWFVELPEGSGHETTFRTAEELLARDEVLLCHPELIHEVDRKAAFPPQWHLKKTTVGGTVVDAHASVEAAWSLSEGDGTTIAIVDDGVDLDHEEFAGAGKIVAPRDVTRGNDNPRPGVRDAHGTACAGVACANGNHGAAGVAPKARLMPIRLVSNLGSQAEADAFVWAADHGADVISCSWGPVDGAWWDPADPQHDAVVPLPDSTRLAIDYAVQQGRGGKGCVITWAAGNGNESVDHDGYASYPRVIAVAACNDRSKRAAYSDTGDALWCAFPSSDGTPSLTPGIWTTDVTGGRGYNAGNPTDGDAAGKYTRSFGGTSSACPGAAGVAALVIARNPELRWDEVKEILRRSCDRIDTAGGAYDGDGHSAKYGYGRLNALRAVQLAVPDAPGYTAVHTAIQSVPVEDLKTSRIRVAVGDTAKIRTIKVQVDIEHTWIGDLVVALRPPSGLGVTRVVLHDRAGDGTQNLRRAYDPTSTPGLGALIGLKPTGTWTLDVEDKAHRDTGRIVSFAVELGL